MAGTAEEAVMADTDSDATAAGARGTPDGLTVDAAGADIAAVGAEAMAVGDGEADSVSDHTGVITDGLTMLTMARTDTEAV